MRRLVLVLVACSSRAPVHEAPPVVDSGRRGSAHADARGKVTVVEVRRVRWILDAIYFPTNS